MKFAGLAILSLALLVGCGSSYMTAEKPLILKACGGDAESPMDKSFYSLVLAMKDNHWAIKQVDPQRRFVQGEACRRRYCISVDGTAQENGQIIMLRTPQQNVGDTEILEVWMDKLQKRYTQACVQTPASLKKGMQNSGYLD